MVLFLFFGSLFFCLEYKVDGGGSDFCSFSFSFVEKRNKGFKRIWGFFNF